MPKIHTRAKRKYRLSTHLNQQEYFHPVERIRPRTFRTIESAQNWAKKHNITGYNIGPAKKKRFKIVVKNGTNKDTAD